MSDAPFQLIPLDQVAPSGTNPRSSFDEPALADLAESIRVHGVLQPILVRPLPPHAAHIADDVSQIGRTLKSVVIGHPGDEDRMLIASGLSSKEAAARLAQLKGARFLLVAGERRWRAARGAGLKEIPALVRKLDDKAALEIQVIENLQRADLHPLEEAEGYETLMALHGYSADGLAAKVGKSKGYIYARMKLTALGAQARKAFASGRIHASVALLIARIPDPKAQEELLEDVAANEHEGPTPEKRVRELIHRKYLLRLAGAPFDPKDRELVPGAGACADCPKRTGNQRELFPDVSAADVCTDPACFAAKRAAAAERKLAAAREEGREVIAGKPAEALFCYGRLRTDDFVDLKDRCGMLGLEHDKSWKATLGKDCPDTVLAVDPEGNVHELLRREDARAALKAKGLKPSSTSQGSNESWRLQERNRAKAKKELRARAIPLIGQVAAKLPEFLFGGSPQVLEMWRRLARQVNRELDIDRHTTIAVRRGLATSQANSRDGLTKWLEGDLTLQDCQEFIIEALLCARYSSGWEKPVLSDEFKELCAFAGVKIGPEKPAGPRHRKKKK